MQLRLLFVFTDMILPLAVGYFLHKKGILSDAANNLIIKANIIFFITLLALLSFWILPLSPSVLILPAFGIILTIVPALFAKIFFVRSYSDILDQGSYMMSAMLANIGTLGGLCAFILYDEIGYAVIQLVAMLQNMMFILICLPLAKYYRAKADLTSAEAHVKFSRDMFLTWNQLGVVGMIAGLALNFFGVPRPEALGTIFQVLIHVSAWFALLPVGYLMNFQKAKPWYRRALSLVPLHFVMLPLAIYFPARILFDEPMVINILLLAAAAPSAINAVLAARINRLNVDFTIASFLMTTAIFLLVLFPLFFLYVAHGGSF